MMIPIFSLLLQHEFFRQSKWLQASLVPNLQSQLLIDRFQMKLVKMMNCWCLYAFGQSSRISFLQNFSLTTEGNPLLFWICQPKSDLILLTDLPVNWQGLLLYQNRQKNDRTETCEGQGESITLTAKTIPFQKAPPGAIGQVLFYPEELIVHSSYIISLQSRATQWVYRLFQRGQLILRQPGVVDESGKLNIPVPTPYTAANGESGWQVCTGENCLPLCEVPKTKLKLVDKYVVDSGQTIQRTILAALPTPTADTLSMAEGGELISVVNVYY